MSIVKCDNTQRLPYEIVELILNNFNEAFLVELFIHASKYNPEFALHIKCVIRRKENPLKKYICRIYSTISTINTMKHYMNIVSIIYNLNLTNINIIKIINYKRYLTSKISNEKDKQKFENLTKPIGKYYE
jgi:hypothetical protein